MEFKECYDTCSAILTERTQRIRLRNEYGIIPDKIVANASPLSPEEPDGCCGTDQRHIKELARRLTNL